MTNGGQTANGAQRSTGGQKATGGNSPPLPFNPRAGTGSTKGNQNQNSGRGNPGAGGRGVPPNKDDKNQHLLLDDSKKPQGDKSDKRQAAGDAKSIDRGRAPTGQTGNAKPNNGQRTAGGPQQQNGLPLGPALPDFEALLPLQSGYGTEIPPPAQPALPTVLQSGATAAPRRDQSCRTRPNPIGLRSAGAAPGPRITRPTPFGLRPAAR